MTSRHVWRYRAGSAVRPAGWWLAWVHELTADVQPGTLAELRASVAALERLAGDAQDVEIEWPSADDDGTRLALVVWERPRVLESTPGLIIWSDEYLA